MPKSGRPTLRTGDSGGGSTVPSWLLPVAWLVVGVPLAYGVYETVVKAIDLFG